MPQAAAYVPAPHAAHVDDEVAVELLVELDVDDEVAEKDDVPVGLLVAVAHTDKPAAPIWGHVPDTAVSPVVPQYEPAVHGVHAAVVARPVEKEPAGHTTAAPPFTQ